MRPRPELALGRKPILARASVYAFGSLFAVAVAWSHWTRVDVVVRSPGVVRPEGDLVRIVSEAAAAVESVRVREGDTVRRGEVLVRLDDRDVRLEGQALEQQMAFARAQLGDIKLKVRDATAVHAVEVRKLDAEIASAREDLDRRRAEYAAALGTAELQVSRARAEHAWSMQLAEAGLGSLQSLDRMNAELHLAEARRAEIAGRRPTDHSLEPLLESRNLVRARFEAHLGELAGMVPGIESQLADLQLRRDRNARDRERRLIRSPATGRITLLAALHPGEHLAAGALVATLVPGSARLIIEAHVPNRDAEHIEAGQAARLIFNESTVFDGTVLSISPDARFGEAQAGAYRVMVRPAADDLRLGLALEVRFLTQRESVLSLLFTRIRSAFDPGM